MAFKENSSQQMTLTDSFWGLTEREKKALENSWAGTFAEEIFPSIDESRFSVLYSDKASRPNTPVNVIIGALLIKELFDYSDDEMVENLIFQGVPEVWPDLIIEFRPRHHDILPDVESVAHFYL